MESTFPFGEVWPYGFVARLPVVLHAPKYQKQGQLGGTLKS